MEGISGVGHSDLLISILQHLGELVGPIADAQAWPANVLDEYLAMSSTIGREVSVSLPSGQVVDGLAVGLDPQGRLEIEGSDGTRTTVSAGDVVHLR